MSKRSPAEIVLDMRQANAEVYTCDWEDDYGHPLAACVIVDGSRAKLLLDFAASLNEHEAVMPL